MTLRVRRIALTADVSSSVGWLGAVAGFLVLAVTGLRGEDPQLNRAAYLAMELTTWFVILPFAAASLLTGIVSSLGTAWGLLRYYQSPCRARRLTGTHTTAPSWLLNLN